MSGPIPISTSVTAIYSTSRTTALMDISYSLGLVTANSMTALEKHRGSWMNGLSSEGNAEAETVAPSTCVACAAYAPCRIRPECPTIGARKGFSPTKARIFSMPVSCVLIQPIAPPSAKMRRMPMDSVCHPHGFFGSRAWPCLSNMMVPFSLISPPLKSFPNPSACP